MTKRQPLNRGKSCESPNIFAARQSIHCAAIAIGFGVLTTGPALSGPAPSGTAMGLWGVWHGKTDDAEIYLCIQSDPAITPYDDFAAIYTIADDLIELLDRSDDDQANWTARNDDNVAARLLILGGGSIMLDRTDADLWSGIKLAPLPLTKSGEIITPYNSPEFNLPRGVMPSLQVTARKLVGVPYDVITLVYPAGHGEVSTFQFQYDQQGSERINKWLKAFLPTTASLAPYYTYTIDALGGGFRSIWNQRIFPEMISYHFVVANC